MAFDTKILKTQAPDLLGLVSPLTPLRKIGGSGGGEWSGACPFCGGSDRFSVQPYHEEPRWLCRHCTEAKWKDVIEFVQRRDGINFVDACTLLFGDNVKIAIDPAELERLKAKQHQAIQDQENATSADHERNRQSLHDSGIAQEYHANLDKFGRRDLWHERGLNDFFIDVYRVGFCPSFPFGNQKLPTLTIPTWRAGHVVGLAHRALADNPPGGKYRPERAGLGKALFFADPDVTEITGDVLLLEGEIKTAVTFSRIYNHQPTAPHPIYKYELIGIAGTAFKKSWVPEFKEADKIVLCLDPDATDKAYKIADVLGRSRCKIAELPGKIDDLFIMGVLDMDLLYDYIHGAL